MARSLMRRLSRARCPCHASVWLRRIAALKLASNADAATNFVRSRLASEYRSITVCSSRITRSSINATSFEVRANQCCGTLTGKLLVHSSSDRATRQKPPATAEGAGNRFARIGAKPRSSLPMPAGSRAGRPWKDALHGVHLSSSMVGGRNQKEVKRLVVHACVRHASSFTIVSVEMSPSVGAAMPTDARSTAVRLQH